MNTFFDILKIIFSQNIGQKKICISNYPYACFLEYTDFIFPKKSGRPSRLTILKAKRKLNKAFTIEERSMIIRDKKK